MLPLGILSGRLSAPIKNRMTAFPYKTWKEEFKIANNLGLTSIEWIFEHPNKSLNPICTKRGIKTLRELSAKYKIDINSILAFNFLEDPLFNEKLINIKKSKQLINFLIDQCFNIGIKMIILPLMGKNSIKEKSFQKELIANISDNLDYANKKKIKIIFELDLTPNDYINFIHSINHSAVGINYDIGNSVINGFNPIEEINELNKYILNVHIKDAIKNGYSVPLGEGEADFNQIFSLLKSNNYCGQYIFESARQDSNNTKTNLDPFNTILININFINEIYSLS